MRVNAGGCRPTRPFGPARRACARHRRRRPILTRTLRATAVRSTVGISAADHRCVTRSLRGWLLEALYALPTPRTGRPRNRGADLHAVDRSTTWLTSPVGEPSPPAAAHWPPPSWAARDQGLQVGAAWDAISVGCRPGAAGGLLLAGATTTTLAPGASRRPPASGLAGRQTPRRHWCRRSTPPPRWPKWGLLWVYGWTVFAELPTRSTCCCGGTSPRRRGTRWAWALAAEWIW